MRSNKCGDRATEHSLQCKILTMSDQGRKMSPQAAHNCSQEADSEAVMSCPKIIWREPCSQSLERLNSHRNLIESYNKVAVPIRMSQCQDDTEDNSANLSYWPKSLSCRCHVSQSCRRMSDNRSKKYAACDREYMRNYVMHGLKNMRRKCSSRQKNEIESVLLANGVNSSIPYCQYNFSEKKIPPEVYRRQEKRIIRRNPYTCPVKMETEKDYDKQFRFFKNTVMKKMACPHWHSNDKCGDRNRSRIISKTGKQENNKMMSAIVNNDIERCKDTISTFNLKSTILNVRGDSTHMLMPTIQQKTMRANPKRMLRSTRKSKVIDRWTSNVINNILRSCFSDIMLNILKDITKDNIEENVNKNGAMENVSLSNAEVVDPKSINAKPYIAPMVGLVPPSDDSQDPRHGSHHVSDTGEIIMDRKGEDQPTNILPPGIVPPVIFMPGEVDPGVSPVGLVPPIVVVPGGTVPDGSPGGLVSTVGGVPGGTGPEDSSGGMFPPFGGVSGVPPGGMAPPVGGVPGVPPGGMVPPVVGIPGGPPDGMGLPIGSVPGVPPGGMGPPVGGVPGGPPGGMVPFVGGVPGVPPGGMVPPVGGVPGGPPAGMVPPVGGIPRVPPGEMVPPVGGVPGDSEGGMVPPVGVVPGVPPDGMVPPVGGVPGGPPGGMVPPVSGVPGVPPGGMFPPVGGVPGGPLAGMAPPVGVVPGVPPGGMVPPVGSVPGDPAGGMVPPVGGVPGGPPGGMVPPVGGVPGGPPGGMVPPLGGVPGDPGSEDPTGGLVPPFGGVPGIMNPDGTPSGMFSPVGGALGASGPEGFPAGMVQPVGGEAGSHPGGIIPPVGVVPIVPLLPIDNVVITTVGEGVGGIPPPIVSKKEEVIRQSEIIALKKIESQIAALEAAANADGEDIIAAGAQLQSLEAALAKAKEGGEPMSLEELLTGLDEDTQRSVEEAIAKSRDGSQKKSIEEILMGLVAKKKGSLEKLEKSLEEKEKSMEELEKSLAALADLTNDKKIEEEDLNFGKAGKPKEKPRSYVERSLVKSLLQREKPPVKKSLDSFQIGQVHESIFGRCLKPMVVPMSLSLRSSSLIKSLTSHTMCGIQPPKKPKPICCQKLSRLCPLSPTMIEPPPRFPLPSCGNKTAYCRLKYSKSCGRNSLRPIPICSTRQYACSKPPYYNSMRCKTVCNMPGPNKQRFLINCKENAKQMSSSR